HDTLDFVSVPRYPSAIETRSLPTLTRAYPRHFTLITRTARARASYLAALPSTRAIETPSLPSSLAATHRGFSFYVAFPESSIPSLATCSMSRVPRAPFFSLSSGTAFDVTIQRFTDHVRRSFTFEVIGGSLRAPSSRRRSKSCEIFA